MKWSHFSNPQALADYQLKEFGDFLNLGGSLTDNVSKNHSFYLDMLNKASSDDPKDYRGILMQVTQSIQRLPQVEKAIKEDNVVHNHRIRINDQKLAAAEADYQEKLAAAEAHYQEMLAVAEVAKAKIAAIRGKGEEMRNNQLMSTGKAEAFCYVGNKALRNIQDAIFLDDKGDLVEMKRMNDKWKESVKEDQVRMMNGGTNAIQLILAGKQEAALRAAE